MSSKINDLNPKNEIFNAYQAKVKSIVSRQAQSIYQDKNFADEFRSVFVSSVSLRLVANIVSSATFLVAVYWGLFPLIGSFLAVLVGLLSCILFEVLKSFVWRITNKYVLKYKTVSFFLVASLVGLHLVSFGGSCFGAWQLPCILIAPTPSQATVQNIDSINTTYLVQLATIDKQLEQLQDKTNSSTIRKAINNLTEQKKQVLSGQNLAIQDAKEKNQAKVKENKQQLKTANFEHQAHVHKIQVSSLCITAFFEVLFILCSIFIAYYLFRQYVDDSEQDNQQPSVKDGDKRLITGDNSEKSQASEIAHQAPKATNKIGFEQGKNNEQAKRQDGNRQELEYTKICALDSCKEPFLHNIHNQKYCSTDCRKLAYEKRKAINTN
jgi:hypothetical protein